MVHIQDTGLGTVFQMSAAYSAIDRSLEKRPDPATFSRAFSAQAPRFVYSAPARV
jgi:hypothetical protein